jgi:hypothetical protein
MNKRRFLPLLLLAMPALAGAGEERDATQIVRDAVDHWRGLS